MARGVTGPPTGELRADDTLPGGWWHATDDAGRILCDLCPRACHLKPGDRGFCFVRENRDGQMVLTTYGRSTGFCIDPIEKKPLNHFYPGTSVLSFGTAGCNLGCKFCQNHDISKAREIALLSQRALPETIAGAAQQLGCRSVAYTYNDPVVWAEYAIDTARACRRRGIKSVAVTAGYISPEARAPFFELFDAANIDLKAFREEFYQQLTLSHLQPVLDTLEWLRRETEVWLEITNLVIPGANDDLSELREMCQWILSRVGDEVPVHFTAFHPDFRMLDRERTPPELLLAAQAEAQAAGLKYVYVGNVDDAEHQSTYCAACGRLVIQRNWYELGEYHLDGNQCGHCGAPIAGHFDSQPGEWGRRRQPIRIEEYAATPPPGAVATQEPTTMSRSGSATSHASGGDSPLQKLPELTRAQQDAIHAAASEIVCATIQQRPVTVPDTTMAGAADSQVWGTYVTLKRSGQLRSCCGFIGPATSLPAALQLAATRTASEDMRLPPISPSELDYLHLEVWLLQQLEPIPGDAAKRQEQVTIGRHGLKIEYGGKAGLLLPGVATEQGYDSGQFLQAVCHKASLPPTTWKQSDCQLSRFEGCSFGGPINQAAIALGHVAVGELCARDDLYELLRFCQDNTLQMSRGAVPNYYLPGVTDGMVHAAAIKLSGAAGDGMTQVSRISLRPGMPLQATLHMLAETLAQKLASSGAFPERTPQGGWELTFGYDPAMHGTVARPDLRGIDPACRGLLVMQRQNLAWLFDPHQSAEQLLERAVVQAKITHPDQARIFSLKTQSTGAMASLVHVPVPTGGAEVRPAAVAGRFYPAAADQLQRELREILPSPAGPRERFEAAMVPHAGWRYSGAIAAATLSRLQFPPTVIAIGPKHTRAGVDWAVAPHTTWALPGLEVASDPQLARQLVDAVPGLELDAAAHEAEHGIEVELPLIHHLAPHAKVVGIALGPATWEQCRNIAQELSQVVRSQPGDVLLLISSDMNHFANDTENRRLDALAIRALESLQPADVYQTCRENRISMCGMIPAVIVMETLRQLGRLNSAECVDYDTSANVSGDTSRVVGYCGMLFR